MISLRYEGKKGEFIMGVPARDLSQYDLENIAHLRGDTVEQVVNSLTSRGLYQRVEEYVCEDCGKVYKSYDGFHKHVLTHVEKEGTPEVDPENLEEAD